MKRLLSLLPLLLLALSSAQAQVDFDQWFTDQTLRLDYAFAGDAHGQRVYLDEMRRLSGWAGRRHRLDEMPAHGNGQLTVRDAETGKVLYCHAFSSLFMEWTGTPEATQTQRAFENVFLVPMPRKAVRVTVTLFDFRQQVLAEMTHPVDPADILIRQAADPQVATEVLHAGAVDNPIDIVIMAEGYTAEEMPAFLADARRTADELLRYEPFHSLADRLRLTAVQSPSRQSGVSVPRQNDWRETAVGSHFDTFYSDRYLTTLHLKQVHDWLTAVPYEHIIILANTGTYGGGGIFNSYDLAAARHPKFLPVVVHEFGHSFAGLADEYYYAGTEDPYYFSDVEPWEANITTKVDFAGKWQDLMGHPGNATSGEVGLFEGAGYQEHGVWRPCQDCRMRTNEAPDFCPVCARELQRLILFYTE